MTLTRNLEINLTLIKDDEHRALQLAELGGRKAGCPVERKALAACLEGVLQNCKKLGILYPPILLRRKREIARGEFVTVSAAPAVAARPATSNSGICPDCSGLGYVMVGG